MKQKYDLNEFVDVPTRQSVLAALVERIRARRKERGLSQKQLAIRSGVSYASVRRFETEGEISLSSLLRIAQALDCLQDFDMLFSGKDDRRFEGVSGMIAEVKKVTVRYNGRTVGYLAQIEEGVIGFQYDDGWLKGGFSISPLSLPLRKDIFVSKKRQFDRLYGVFWDSLPDGWGELLVKRYLAKQGINYDRLSPLTKLSLIGENGLGGLNYEPSQFAGESTDAPDFDTLAREVDKILNDENADDLDAVYRLGGSSGGARPKAHLHIDGEEWIVKFPCRIDPQDVGELEYRANVAARECGIDVNEFRLFPSRLCSGYFGAKRFDRKAGKRLHVLSLAALLETTHRQPNLDYGHLFNVTENICADLKEMYEVFRRMCFNVYYGNKDDHSKNFAFLYDEKIGGYLLSPAYDLTKTVGKFEHEMTVNGAGNPSDADILAIAEDFKLNLQTCCKIMEEIKAQIEG